MPRPDWLFDQLQLMTDMDQRFDQLIDLAEVNRRQPDLPKAPQMLAAPAGTRIPVGLSESA